MLNFTKVGSCSDTKTHITVEDETIVATRLLCSKVFTITTTLPIGTGDFTNKAMNLVNLCDEEFKDFADLSDEDYEECDSYDYV